ncbi:unnamed protein product [Caenorhabditis auriculariae]|uniref:G-protein coupled receptors family 1 profile domain-containing protein n=1 Tax=Caenorhabditis auriculariae TaxID=2777116 RepID=A0A8S1HL27_9PELO|nr:unnamed protein product [Caenorhabditis auriculariae]
MNGVRILMMSLHSILSLSGCSFNLLLIYVVIFHSPSRIKTYSILILNFAITDFVLCFSSFFNLLRFVPIGDSIIWISSGPCRIFGYTACLASYNIGMHLVSHSLYSLLYSFSYRYYILLRSAPKVRSVLIFLAIVYSPSFLSLILSFRMASPSNLMREILLQHFPKYDVQDTLIGGTADMQRVENQLITSIGYVPVIPFYIAILIIRRRIIKKLEVVDSSLSDETKSIQKQFLKALTFQALIPVCNVVALVAYTIEQLNIYSHPILDYVAIFVPIGDSVVWISGGPCLLFGYTSCLVSYNFGMHLISHSLYSLLYSFSYRYYILGHPAPKLRSVLIVLALVYSPSFLSLILSFRTASPSDQMRDILLQNFPNYDVQGVLIGGIANMQKVETQLITSIGYVPVIPFYIAILIIRKKIINKLNSVDSSLRHDTKNIQKQFLKALTFQALIPVCNVVALVAYTIEQLNIYSHPILDYAAMSVLLVPILTPIFSLYFVSAYRKRVKSLLQLKLGSVGPRSLAVVSTASSS